MSWGEKTFPIVQMWPLVWGPAAGPLLRPFQTWCGEEFAEVLEGFLLGRHSMGNVLLLGLQGGRYLIRSDDRL